MVLADNAAAVLNVRSLMAAGIGKVAACRRAGITPGRYDRATAAEVAEITSRIVAPAAPAPCRRGRPAALELTAAEALGLTHWCGIMKGGKPGLERWLEESALPVEKRAKPEIEPASPVTIAALQLLARRKKVTWPQSVRRAMQVSINIRGKIRGGHEELRATPSARRALTIIDEDGEIRQVLAGSIFASDDMSHNEPHRYYSPEANDGKGGETVGRQSLLTCDLYSHALLAENLIGRKKDAYRLEDIANHVTQVIDMCGLPLVWRFERGTWDSSWLWGLEPPPSWLLPKGTLFGAIDGVLFHARQKFTPRGKGEIENAFRLYQRHLYQRHTSLGTIRGEYKATARLYRQAIAGNPLALRAFWTIQEARAAHEAGLTAYNTTEQVRRAHGNVPHAPAALWQGARTRTLAAGERWRLLPWKAWGSVREGVYECKVNHYPVSFRFAVSGTPGCPTLDHGHRVFAAFSPSDPGAGCYLFNAEPKGTRSHEHGRRVNCQGFSLLQPLGLAAYWPDEHQENLTRAGGDFSVKKRAAAALRSEFTAAFPRGAGLAHRSVAQDEYGKWAGKDQSAMPDAPAPQALPADTPPARRAAAADAPIDLVTLYRRALPAREAEAAAH